MIALIFTLPEFSRSRQTFAGSIHYRAAGRKPSYVARLKFDLNADPEPPARVRPPLNHSHGPRQSLRDTINYLTGNEPMDQKTAIN